MPTPAERLAAGLKRQPNGCLEWTRYTNTQGYGRISVDGKDVRTHRFAWELANGLIPPGMHVLHHCDNPPCCETEPTPGYPDGHLFLGTQADNMRDRATKGRDRSANAAKTHCPKGHEYTEANTYAYADGRRHCWACNREGARRRYAIRREDLTTVPDGHPTVAEDLDYVAWIESQDHELPCGCMASDPVHHCEDPVPDDDNPHEERP